MEIPHPCSTLFSQTTYQTPSKHSETLPKLHINIKLFHNLKLLQQSKTGINTQHIIIHKPPPFTITSLKITD